MARFTLPFRLRRLYWVLPFSLTIVLPFAWQYLPAPVKERDVLLASLGGVWALAFYLHGQHAEDARFLKELLREFNERYAAMNDGLRADLVQGGDFEADSQGRFIDYFNLCAEEWLFHRAGYIYKEVWTAWRNGMIQYGKDPRVAALWKAEKATNSYYGFEFPVSQKT